MILLQKEQRDLTVDSVLDEEKGDEIAMTFFVT